VRDDRERLLDMLEAIEKIEERIKGDKNLLQHDEVVQVRALYHIQIIGEATSRIFEPLRASCPSIPSRSRPGMGRHHQRPACA
jgi:uncharacterized protein with HEPN domain